MIKGLRARLVRAQRFELVDGEGAVLATLGPNPGRGASLVLRNRRGKLCAELAAVRGGGETLHDEGGRLRVLLDVKDDGDAVLGLYDHESNIMWSVPTEIASPAVAPREAGNWIDVASWSGKSIRSTEKFTVGSPWKIVWDTRPGDLGAMNFQIFIYGEDEMPGVAANVIGADQDESIQHKAGTYYLQFNTAQRYTVKVLEWR